MRLQFCISTYKVPIAFSCVLVLRGSSTCKFSSNVTLTACIITSLLSGCSCVLHEELYAAEESIVRLIFFNKWASSSFCSGLLLFNRLCDWISFCGYEHSDNNFNKELKLFCHFMVWHFRFSNAF